MEENNTPNVEIDKYLDPPNVEEILDQIKSCPTLGDVVQTVTRLYPDWILGVLPDYSPDYPILTENWHNICFKNNVEPKKIVLVQSIYFDDIHVILKTFSEILTLSGFCVRTKNDLFACNKCGLALPQSHLYDLLKEKVEDIDDIPPVWSVLCEDCE
jgi:hypothetical protein